MNDTHEIISAFLDDEPFDADELARALGDPSGRALLIDLVALRHVVQPDALNAALQNQSRSVWRPWLAAAAMVVALVGGYYLGERQTPGDPADPPAPSRVIQADAWQTLPEGGRR